MLSSYVGGAMKCRVLFKSRIYSFIRITQVKFTTLQRPTNFLSLFRESLCLLQNLGTFLCLSFTELENVTLYIYLRPCRDKRFVCKKVLQNGGC